MKKIQLPKVLTEKSFKKRIYSYWQFWLVVLALCAGTFYLDIYLIAWGNDVGYRIKAVEQKELQQAYLDYKDKVLADLKADTYGGSTPEETLRMFIEALETVDYDLAVKYLVQDERSQFEKDLKNPLAEDGIKRMILAYREGTVIVKNDDGPYEFIITAPGSELGFHMYAKLNSQTKIWKLSDI